MSAEEEVLYSVEDHVAGITINRPERRNALTWSAIEGLHRHLAAAKADDDVRVVVLKGAGGRAFCAGLDLGQEGGSHAARHQARGGVGGLFTDLWSLGKPTIAAVQGFAVAGGFGLALACDLVVCTDDSVFAAPEIDVGLWPFMITVPLVRSMPPKKALELMLTGRRIGSAEADRLGLVTKVVAPEALDGEVADLAATLAAKSPLAMKLGRDSFYAVWDMAAADALAVLHPLLTVMSATDDAQEGRAAFAEKRRPNWSGS
ncbi:MAG TPA: enoyl-CoA hydratase-related protein [Acidimicrobiales bacterium]|jgi:enoyl-CoA hydratase/carnithine racemase|nr:enoyl-CoA hydratase-related protein [Acidimicrobiales bacterium]